VRRQPDQCPKRGARAPVRPEEGGRWWRKAYLSRGHTSLLGQVGRQLAAGTRRPVPAHKATAVARSGNDNAPVVSCRFPEGTCRAWNIKSKRLARWSVCSGRSRSLWPSYWRLHTSPFAGGQWQPVSNGGRCLSRSQHFGRPAYRHRRFNLVRSLSMGSVAAGAIRSGAERHAPEAAALHGTCPAPLSASVAFAGVERA
jgi:hypothetical protein